MSISSSKPSNSEMSTAPTTPIKLPLAEPFISERKTLHRLNGRMTEEKLNLFQLAAGQVAQACTAATKIMWSKIRYSGPLGSSLHDMPHSLSA
jgi:hypothetical protein